MLLQPTTNSHQGHISSSSLNSLFDSPSGSVSQSSPFRRRRPIYVGAGYSSQGSRRRKQGAQSTGDQGLTRSKSDGMVYEMANGSSGASGGSGLADGKRRRVDEEAPSNVPLESGFGLRGSTSTPSFSSSPEPSSEPKRMSTLTKATSSLLSYAKPVTTTPARPSPLWQVSKAGLCSRFLSRVVDCCLTVVLIMLCSDSVSVSAKKKCCSRQPAHAHTSCRPDA